MAIKGLLWDYMSIHVTWKSELCVCIYKLKQYQRRCEKTRLGRCCNDMAV